MVRILLLSVILSNPVTAAPKATGPATANPGDLVKISLTEVLNLNDPQFNCYPINSNWEAVKKFDGQTVILFFCKDPGKFTFVFAANSENKTILVVHEVIVSGVPPPNPEPIPPPSVKGKYTDELRPSYLVNPDPVNLDKLISVYERIAARSKDVSTNTQLRDLLIQVTQDIVGATALTKVRDSVDTILQRDLTNKTTDPYDAAKAASIFNELAKSLRYLK